MFKLKESNQTVGGAIADSFSLLKHTWAASIVVILIGIVVSIIIMLAFGMSSFKTVSQLILLEKSGNAAGVQAMMQSGSFIHSIILLAIGLFLTAWIFKIINAILVRLSWNVAQTGSAQLGNAFKVGLKYFWVYLLLMLVLIGIHAVMFLILWLVSMAHMHYLSVIFAILTQLGVYYIIIKLILVETSAVVDECGIKSFSRSWCVTKKSWWRTLAVLTFTNLFYVIILYLIGLGIFWAVFMPGLNPPFAEPMMQHAPIWFSILFLIAAIATGLAVVFSVPSMYASSQTVLYDYLKKLRAGKKS